MWPLEGKSSGDVKRLLQQRGGLSAAEAQAAINGGWPAVEALRAGSAQSRYAAAGAKVSAALKRVSATLDRSPGRGRR